MISSLASASVQSPRLAFAGRVGALSASADAQAAKATDDVDAPGASSTSADSSALSAASTDASSPASLQIPGDQLTSQEQRLLEQLRQIDRQVRAHEQAHMAAGAGLVRGGVSFSYETGPDEKRYAVGGEVSIDVTRASTPQETLVKARQIRAAALAPADPSAQDQNVAAHAARMASEAIAEIAAQQREAITAQSGTQFYRGVERGSRAQGTLAVNVDLYA